MSTDEDTISNRKVWIDTDAGTDDAIALMVAMSHTNTDIIGISTVGGNVALDCVNQNVLYICELYGRSIPVYSGSAQPLERALGTADFIHGIDGLGDIGLPLTGRTPNDITAVQALIDAIETYPGELEVIALGPLTNLAKAIQKQPSITSHIKHLHIMGGLIDGPGNVTAHAEYNIWADPEAAQYILSLDISTTTIGWDTTVNTGYFTLDEIDSLRAIGTYKAQIAADMQMVRIKWQIANGQSPSVTWADPTAMIATLYPESIQGIAMVDMTVRGGDDNAEYRGYIDVRRHEQGCITHVTAIDRDFFKEVIRHAVS